MQSGLHLARGCVYISDILVFNIDELCISISCRLVNRLVYTNTDDS